jgi:transmembrane sensor
MTSFAELPMDMKTRLQAAAEWSLRLRKNPSLEFSQEYITWISKRENLEAIRAVDNGWASVAQFSSSPEMLELRRSALQRVRGTGKQSWFSSKAAHRIAAALVVSSIAGATLFFNYENAATEYQTEVGVRRVIALPDGSRISMDSNSEVHVRYTKTARILELDRGRARFDVAHDPERPFTVSANGETVIAVGTSFNVERLASALVVTLIQGHVVIKKSDGTETTMAMAAKRPQAVSLTAGEQFISRAGAQPVIAQANLQTAVAWESGHIILKDETLGEAVERMNRYTDKPISVDPSVAGIRISGVFNAGDMGAFVSAVTSYFPVQASLASDNTIVLQRRS